jgi:V8-like Glu-specific endopeptidase
MTIAILKLSYNKAGESPVTGGICGSAFVIGRHTAITAHHTLSNHSFKPNEGYKSCQYWLLSRSGAVYELSRTQLIDYPDIDTTIIEFGTKVDMRPLQLSETAPSTGEAVYNEGFVANAMPDVKATWRNKRLQITGHSLAGVMFDQKGFIRNVGRITLKSNDVNLNNVEVIETSYPGCIGMSGGPLMRAETGEVIGLMSFGLPPDTPVKQAVAAVSIGEIVSVVEIR